MAQNKVTYKKCGNVFDWNDQWPEGLKRCPLCGMLVGVNVPPTKSEPIKQPRPIQVEVDEYSVTKRLCRHQRDLHFTAERPGGFAQRV